MARGLGSSSACIVAGILGANRFMGNPLSHSDLINLAAQIEGHPDNTSRPFRGAGGLRPWRQAGVQRQRARLGEDPLCVMIPPFELKTEEARAALPKTYSREDAVYNLSRSGLMTASLFSGKLENLRVAVQDRIHQPTAPPYRPL